MAKEKKTTHYLIIAGLLLGANIVHYFVLPTTNTGAPQRPHTAIESSPHQRQTFDISAIAYHATRNLFEPVRPPVLKPIIAKPKTTPDKKQQQNTSKFNQLNDLKFLGSLTKGETTYAFITLKDKEMTLKTGDKIASFEDFVVTNIQRSYIEISLRDSKYKKVFGGVE